MTQNPTEDPPETTFDDSAECCLELATPLLIIENEADCPPGTLIDFCDANGQAFEVCRPYLGDAIPNPFNGDYRGLVILGGGMGPSEDEKHPWLKELRDLLAEAAATEFPTLNICLGAELLAVAIGEGVDRARSAEVGLSSITLTEAAVADPVFSNLVINLPRIPVWQWHQEYIPALPENSELLATSEAFPIQAFRTGSCMWSTQFHPEITPEIARRWAATSTLNPGRAPEAYAGDVDARLDTASLVLDGFVSFLKKKCAGQ